MNPLDLFVNVVEFIVLLAIGFLFVSVWIDAHKWRQKRKENKR